MRTFIVLEYEGITVLVIEVNPSLTDSRIRYAWYEKMPSSADKLDISIYRVK